MFVPTPLDGSTPGASPLVLTSKLLGEFTMPEWGDRNSRVVRLQLVDDVLGPIRQQASLPNILDWQAVGTTANNPIRTSVGIPASISDQSAVQLAFGEDWVLALPHLIPWESPDPAYEDRVIVPICTTADLGAVDQNMVTNLRVRWLAYADNGAVNVNNGELGVQLRDIPRTIISSPAFGTAAAVTETVWTVEKSPTIVKDGKSFQIVYLVVNCNLGILQYSNVTAGNWDVGPAGQYAQLGGYPAPAVAWAGHDYRVTACRVLDWYVKGVPLSAITQQTSPVQHAVDVLTDLVTEYSNNTSITVNADSAARVKAGNSEAACAGVIQAWTQGPKKGEAILTTEPPSLREAITALCQSSDLDVFINWSSEFCFSSDVWDYTVATQAASLVAIPETEHSGLRTRIPSGNERWAPFNRLFLRGGRGYAAESLEVPFQGPWDFGSGDSAAVALSSRIIEATLEQGWRPYRQQAQDPRYFRSLNVKARELATFRTHIGGLLLDLGAYFKLSWSRGPSVGGPYVETAFQVESIAYSHSDDAVEVSGIWRDDVTTELLSGSASPNDGSTDCFFGGTINLTTMGVQPGDIFVMRCTADPLDEFAGNAAHRIVSVDSPTDITVTPNFGVFSTSPIPNAEWFIVRGATTYPTSFIVGYPDGGQMYGKVTDVVGLFSDLADQGNRLLSG